jgi:hypothetical protein
MKEYLETHQQGHIVIENVPLGLRTFDWSTGHGYMQGDFGVQIAKDGRVWICIDGVAFLRFDPRLVRFIKKPKERLFFNNIREAIRILRGRR